MDLIQDLKDLFAGCAVDEDSNGQSKDIRLLELYMVLNKVAPSGILNKSDDRWNGFSVTSDEAYREIDRLLVDAHIVGENMFIEHTLRYFQGRFETTQIMIERKRRGKQIGSVIGIAGTELTRRYYAKTHSNNWSYYHAYFSDCPDRIHAKASRQVVPYELIVYELLHRFGVGCEVVFYGSDLRDIHITTLDAGAGGSYYEARALPLTGAECALVCSSDHSSARWQSFYSDFIVACMLAQALGLSGLHSDNYGILIPHTLDEARIRIVDFRFPKSGMPPALNSSFLRDLVFVDPFLKCDPRVPVAVRRAWEQLRSVHELPTSHISSTFHRRLEGWNSVVEAACANVLAIPAYLEGADNITVSEREAFASSVTICRDLIRANFKVLEQQLDEGERFSSITMHQNEA